MIKFIGLAVLAASVTTALAGEMSAACTVHGGAVVCFSVPGAAPVASDGPCYAAQKQVVAAQNYAAEHSDEPEIIAQRMATATDKLFKACAAFPASQTANFVAPAARNG
jgi:hypothetical protein